MIQAKCIEKYRDKSNKIIGYKLVDLNNKTQDFSADALKKAIANKKIHVVNLTLTSDGRLMPTTDKSLPYKEDKKVIKKEYKIETKKEDIQISNLAKAFTLLEWSYIDMGDDVEELVNCMCEAAGLKENAWDIHEENGVLNLLNKAHQIIINKNFKLLIGRLKNLLTEEGDYYSEHIKNYMFRECVSKVNDSKMYKAVNLIYKEVKEYDKTLAKIIKIKLLDDMKNNGVASIKVGYEIGHSYFRYLDPGIFGVISNTVFTVGHAISASDIKEHKEYKGYTYVFHKDINRCGAPRISIAALFKNSDTDKVQVDIKIERHGYLNQSQTCVGTRGYILDVESFVIDKNTSVEEHSKLIADKFNEIAPKLYDLADIHQSLYGSLGYNAQLEVVSLDDLNSHGKQYGSLLVNSAISRWTKIRGDRTPAKEHRSEYNSDTNFRILYANNISECGDNRRLYLEYNGSVMTLRVVNGNDINNAIIEEKANISGSVVDRSAEISELLTTALITANVKRI